jgi:CRISPR-associated protein Cmr3
MWQLFIEPNDVLLFRDGKPFVAGEDHRAKSLFPPTPFTMQGVIRSKALFDSDVSPHDYAHAATPAAQALIQQIGGVSSGYGQLQLRGPLVAKRNDDGSITRYFPLPADVVKVGDDFVITKPLRDAPFSDNSPADVQPLWARIDKPLKEARGWLSEEEFNKYRQGQTDFRVTPESDLLVREPRLGIALDYTPRRPHEGMLYQMEFLRLREGVGFALEVDGINPFASQGFLQVGGDARAARYEVIDPLPSLPMQLPQQFKVVLLTPAWFTDGWQPQGGNWKQFFNGDVTLVSAALPRAQSIGGAFADDQRRTGNFQKTMRRFIPAGSVFFFESDGAVTRSGKPFTETPPNEGDFGQIGFGAAIVTEWSYA